jgi:hypothetical protein
VLQKTSEMSRRVFVIFIKTAALNEFHIAQKVHYKPKSKWLGLCLERFESVGWNDSARIIRLNIKSDTSATQKTAGDGFSSPSMDSKFTKQFVLHHVKEKGATT